jgi:hypothetical protein
MGTRTNPRILNVAGILVAILVALAGSAYAVVAFINTVIGHGG